jgi:hypothetical protein
MLSKLGLFAFNDAVPMLKRMPVLRLGPGIVLVFAGQVTTPHQPVGIRPMSDHRAWWTVWDLADHYRISVRTVYLEIERGRLVAHRFGGERGAIRVADEDRTQWEASSRMHSGNGAQRPSIRLNSESAHLVEKHWRLSEIPASPSSPHRYARYCA